MKDLHHARPCGEHVTCISPSNPQNNSVTGTQLGSDKDPQETTQLCIIAQSCLTLCDPMDCSPTGTSVHGDSPGKNTRVSSHVLLQGNLLKPGVESRSPVWQADSLPSEPPGKPMNTAVGSQSLSPGDLSHPGIEPGSLALQADSGHPANKWRILRCGPGYLIPKHVHESAKWKCWFSMINLLFPACSHLLHCWLLNPNTQKLSFDSSFFLTPPSIALAMISVILPKQI